MTGCLLNDKAPGGSYEPPGALSLVFDVQDRVPRTP